MSSPINKTASEEEGEREEKITLIDMNKINTPMIEHEDVNQKLAVAARHCSELLQQIQDAHQASCNGFQDEWHTPIEGGVQEINESLARIAHKMEQLEKSSEDTRKYSEESIKQLKNRIQENLKVQMRQLDEKRALLSKHVDGPDSSSENTQLTELKEKYEQMEAELDIQKKIHEKKLKMLQEETQNEIKAASAAKKEAEDAIKKLQQKLTLQKAKENETEKKHQDGNSQHRELSGGNDTLLKDLKTANETIQNLKKQLAEFETSKREAKNTAAPDRERYGGKFNGDLEKMSKELHKAHMRILELEKDLARASGSNKGMHTRDQNKNLQVRLPDASTRSTPDASTQKKNDPMADDYQRFCSITWLDAKECLDQSDLEQKDAIFLLKEILLMSGTESEKVAEKVNRRLMQVLLEPLKIPKAEESGKELPQPIPEDTQNVFAAMGNYLRRTADSLQLDSICEVVRENIPQTFRKCGILKKKAVENYISKAVRLSWKMSIQQTAMAFSVEGENKKWEGEQSQELYWGSKPDNSGAVVRYYVHPKLKHGDKLMVKGRVMVE